MTPALPPSPGADVPPDARDREPAASVAAGGPAWPPTQRALTVALTATLVVTLVSRLSPDEWANTAVGAVFLGATWLTVLRGDTATIRAFGLSLGGLTEPEPLDARRLLGAGLRALGWAGLMALIFFPPFWLGYKLTWTSGGPFVWRWPDEIVSKALGQLLVIALPEEAFFRGYLQSALDGRWKSSTRKVLGAELGAGWLVASLVFAVGHVLTVPNPARLAVFFPALLFGWMRARTGGVGAGVVFHALCNLLSAFLAEGYGLAG